MRKKLLFLWSILSLLGLVIGFWLTNATAGFEVKEIISTWLFLSLPLIIHLIYFKIFGKE